MKPIQLLTVSCDRCGKKHRVAPRMLGKQASCKRCAKKIILRPKEAVAEIDSGQEFDLGAPEVEEKEYFIPISLTSNPMVDKEYEKESRAQTNFLKHYDKGNSKFGNLIVVLAVFAFVTTIAALGYWFLIPR